MATSAKTPAPTDIYQFYTAREYRTQLISAVRATQPGDRILLMSMTFDPTGPQTAALMHEAELAAARGVQVNIGIDAHSFLVNPAHFPGPMFLRRSMPRRVPPLFRQKLSILERINAYPTGRADIINIPRHGFDLPIAGRSHIKAAIVNDQIWIGGCNLEGEQKIDLMVGWKSEETSTMLFGILLRIIRSRNAARALGNTDYSIPVEAGAQLLIDAGVRNQSIILDEALKLIDSADDWMYMTGQFFPNDITARHLAPAVSERKVKAEIVFTHPRHHGFIGGLGQQASIMRERVRVPGSLLQNALKRDDPYVHAKLLACNKGVMVGSHNYVRAGVLLGTAEIALCSRDERLAKAAVSAFRRGLEEKNIRLE
jgi:hypothetical protein